MTLVAREEKYLMMLRRATLGTARLVLILAALALVLGGATFIWTFLVTPSEFRLPANLASSVDPCGYLMNAQAEANGKDAEGFIPVKSVLTKCDSSAITTPTFPSAESAYNAFADDLISMQKALGWNYNDGEAAAKVQLRKVAEAIQESALRPIQNSTDPQKLVIANAVAVYSAKLRGVTVPSAAWVADRQEDQTTTDQPPTEKPVVDRPTVAHLVDIRFVQNQLATTVEHAKTAYDAAQEQAAARKALAAVALEVALSLFATFLSLMLIFVFIKVEIDLRDIRDALKMTRSTEEREFANTVL